MEVTPVTEKTNSSNFLNSSDALASEQLAPAVDAQLVAELVKRAQADGVPVSGDGGLLQQLTKMVLESSLEGEMDAHLGYAKHDPAGRNGENSRNGKRSKTVLTETGPVEIDVPRPSVPSTGGTQGDKVPRLVWAGRGGIPRRVTMTEHDARQAGLENARQRRLAHHRANRDNPTVQEPSDVG